MRIVYFFTVCLGFLSQTVFGQVKDAVFVGTATVDGGALYSYKLVISDSDHKVTGYSVTDIGGANETKTYIKGSFNSSGKQLLFRETRLAYTKGHLGDTDLCFLKGNLKASNIKGATILRGSFKGYKLDGKTPCGEGKLMLVSAQDLLDKLLEVASRDDLPKDSAPRPMFDALAKHVSEPADSSVKKVAPGKTFEFDAPGSTVALEIWDAKSLDGDIITLMKGSTVLLHKLRIGRTHKAIVVDLGDANSATLRLIAESEGSEPLNTARISISCGDNTQYIDATTVIGTDVYIHIKHTN